MIKPNNKPNLFLFLTVTVIWGVIGMKVFYYFTTGNETEIIGGSGIEFDAGINQEDIRPVSEADDVSYVDLKRDPFLLKKQRVAGKKKKDIPVEQPKIAEDIDFVINGVIMKEDRKLVILQDKTNNSTMFLREGEKYKNLKINFISPSTVSLLQNNKEKKITIE